MIKMDHIEIQSSHLELQYAFPLPCGAGSTVSREGFNLSVIILASLFVCPMLGCRHSLLRLSNNSKFFGKWNVHF